MGGVSRAIQQRITFCMYTDIYNVQEKNVISSASIFLVILSLIKIDSSKNWKVFLNKGRLSFLGPDVNPLVPKSDYILISLDNITPESSIKVTN